MTDPIDPVVPEPTPDPTPDPTPTPDPIEDPAAEIEKWKHFARTHEKAAKANADAAARLQAIEDAAKTQAEKDAEARTAAEQRAAALEAELTRLKVATSKGIPADLAARLVGDTEDEMAEDADRLLALMKPTEPTPTGPAGRADGGPQGQPKVGQLNRDALKTMTPDEIVAAREAGQLNDLLGIS